MPAKQGKEDLRIQKTREAIHKTFEEMICEMDYEQISIKELTERARINRKTFYLHYNTLDDLLKELQNKMAENFIKRTQGLERPRDMDKITREFFLYSEELGKAGERITCSGNYKYISRKITNDIMSQTWKSDSKPFSTNPYIQNVIMTYVSQSTLEIYKQWIADGKRIPLEDIIQIATQLICSGVNGLHI
nr:TetR/AcrR family transcriptional regulator [uncultured Schaedlerella sp.]